MAYAAWSVVFGEQPSAAKWNILGTNDAAFADGSGLPSADAAAAEVATSQTTTTTASWVDLATAGPSVSVDVGQTGLLLFGVSAEIFNSTADIRASISVALSGANTVAAGTYNVNGRTTGTTAGPTWSRQWLATALTPGTTTLTAKYQVQANTGTFVDRRIWAIPL